PRHFLTTLRLRGADGATLNLTGASITPDMTPDTPAVLSTAIGGDDICGSIPAGAAAGKIVVCKRGLVAGRAAPSFNVKQAGGVGEILYNPTRQNLLTDNFWVRTVMLEGPEPANTLVAFLAAHSGVTATWKTDVP